MKQSYAKEKPFIIALFIEELIKDNINIMKPLFINFIVHLPVEYEI